MSKIYFFAKVYLHGLSFLYDFFILGISYKFAWCCPTSTYLLPLYQQHMSRNHLDVGVGAGYFPSTTLKCQRGDTKITIWDSRRKALYLTHNRIRSVRPDIAIKEVHADTLSEPAAGQLDNVRFDSISAFHLLHCIQLNTSEKASKLFGTLRGHLAKDGVLVGCTVLGEVGRSTSEPATTGAMDWIPADSIKDEKERVAKRCTTFGWILMSLYNHCRIFTNWKDGPDAIVVALEKEFSVVETWIVGRVLIFRAKEPKNE